MTDKLREALQELVDALEDAWLGTAKTRDRLSAAESSAKAALAAPQEAFAMTTKHELSDSDLDVIHSRCGASAIFSRLCRDYARAVIAAHEARRSSSESAAAVAEADGRAAFEAWCIKSGTQQVSLAKWGDSDKYVSPVVSDWWLAWQASASRAQNAPTAQQEQRVPLNVQFSADYLLGYMDSKSDEARRHLHELIEAAGITLAASAQAQQGE